MTRIPLVIAAVLLAPLGLLGCGQGSPVGTNGPVRTKAPVATATSVVRTSQARDRAQPASEPAAEKSGAGKSDATTPVGVDASASAGDEKATNYTFDDLKFEMVKGDPFERKMLTPKIEAMFGKRMQIRGYMLPQNFKTGIKKFVLVRDNMECCFGPGAALYDCIVVDMADGKTAEFSIRPITVEGKFTLDEFIGPDRKHLAIYHLEADSAE